MEKRIIKMSKFVSEYCYLESNRFVEMVEMLRILLIKRNETNFSQQPQKD